ncbi:MAG: hypothetical protein KKB03_02475 [Nanoarchaeota archaeon]|nr:hypothetical protein [Nanoarchaeota archaeon]MBU1134986.1 hypothetical protein [Nanoarchaeota archaeon]MBU2520085.1 hypothetical protein [Nanoarchaeota archaeon]
MKNDIGSRGYATRDALKTLMILTERISCIPDGYLSSNFIAKNLSHYIFELDTFEYYEKGGSPKYGSIQGQDIPNLFAPYVEKEIVLENEIMFLRFETDEGSIIHKNIKRGYRMTSNEDKLDELEKEIPELFEEKYDPLGDLSEPLKSL